MRITAIPQIYRHLNRWGEILRILSRYGLAGWIARFDSNFAKNLLKDRDGAALAKHSRETRIRLAFAELGPTFIKLGQILSTRADLIGIELAEELSRLQDATPADPPHAVRELIEKELQQPLEALFPEFDPRPLASASIGQVHRARLPSGEAVVVKVQHAGIPQTIRIDLDIMAGLAILAERSPELANYRPRSVVAEFQRTLRRELDFNRELRSLQHFNKYFADDPTVRIPKPFPECSSSRVLTMELLQGVKLAEAEKCAAAGFDMRQIAWRGADLYLRMIFKYGAYHADPHPGNIVLLPGNVIGLIDFGMVGRIDEKLREDVEEMLLSLINNDAPRLTGIIMRLGSAPRDIDHGALNTDVADFVSHYAHLALDQFDLSGALKEMTEIIRRYHIMLPAPLAMLLKVLVMLEGTSRLASPKFSLVEVMKPHEQGMFWRRLSPLRHWKKARRIYGELERLAELLPRRLNEILDSREHDGNFQLRLDHRGMEPSVNRLVLGLMTSALFLGSAILLGTNTPPRFRDVSILGVSGCVISLALALRLLRAINKSGHLD